MLGERPKRWPCSYVFKEQEKRPLSSGDDLGQFQYTQFCGMRQHFFTHFREISFSAVFCLFSGRSVCFPVSAASILIYKEFGNAVFLETGKRRGICARFRFLPAVQRVGILRRASALPLISLAGLCLLSALLAVRLGLRLSLCRSSSSASAVGSLFLFLCSLSGGLCLRSCALSVPSLLLSFCRPWPLCFCFASVVCFCSFCRASAVPFRAVLRWPLLPLSGWPFLPAFRPASAASIRSKLGRFHTRPASTFFAGYWGNGAGVSPSWTPLLMMVYSYTKMCTHSRYFVVI